MNMRLNTLKPAAGAKTARKRVGRGRGSGTGGTAGRGTKGQKSRSGGYHKVGFEGGQMPLQRRLPKRGFRSKVNKHTAEIRLNELAKVDGDVADLESLKKAGVIGRHITRAKAILSGEITRAVTLRGVAATKGARQAIEKAGGVVEEAEEVPSQTKAGGTKTKRSAPARKKVAAQSSDKPLASDKQPAMKPAEKPAATKPASKPADKPATKQAKKPANKSAEKAPDQPAEKPASKPADKPTAKQAKKPANKSAEKAPNKVPDKSSAKSPDQPAEKPASKPADKPAAKQAKKPANKAAEKVSNKVPDKSSAKSLDQPAEKPAAKKMSTKKTDNQADQPSDQPSKKPAGSVAD